MEALLPPCTLSFKRFYYIISLLVLSCVPKAFSQATYNATTSGNWSAPGTWSVTSGTDSPADGIPDADDTVTMTVNGITVTVNSAQACLSFSSGTTSGGSSSNTLKFANGSTLTVNGQAKIGNSSSPSRTTSLDMSLGGTLTCQSILLTALNLFTAGSGTIILTGTNTLPASASFSSFNNLSVTANTTKLGVNSTVTGKLDIPSPGVFDMNAFTASVGELTGSGSLTNSSTAKILTVGSSNTNSTFTGVLSATTPANLALTKTGTGTLTLSGNNTYTGATVISSGILQLGAAERIANTSPITLSGGTLSTGATTGFSETLGVLTFSTNSTISLGTGVHTLTFANSSAATWAGTLLTINGWTGAAGSGGGGGTAGKIQVGAGGLTSAQLAKIQFTGFPLLGAAITASGELVPKAVYYSKGSLAPNLAGSWNSKSDGSGTDAIAADFTSGTSFTIQNGHTMTTSATWSVAGTGSTILIESGGTLVSTSAITVDPLTTFQIDNGGTYKHQNTGAWGTTIFAGTEIFGNSSTVEINATAVTLPTNSTYGNLIINLTTDPTATISFANILTTINGDFTVLDTKSRDLRLAAGSSPTLNIAGNFSLSGATSILSFTSGAGNPIVTVNGNTTISGGTLNLNVASATGSGTLNCKGNFTHTGGTITQATGTSNVININGAGAQTIESTGFTGAVNFTVAPTGAGTVQIPATKTFVDSGASVFAVSNTSSATELTVNGTLTRTSSANITTAGAVAFSATGKYISNASGGTIPTATWNAASVLQIDATIADNQFTQSFGVVNINNASTFNMLTGASTPTIQGTLTHSGSGSVSLSNSTTLAATLTVAGNVIVSGTGSLVIDNANANTNIAKKIVVNGNYSQSSGTLNLSNNTNASITAATRSAQLDVLGNFSHTGGTISETASDTDMVTKINLVGTTSKSFESTGQTGQVEIALNKTGTAGNDVVLLNANSNIDYKLTLTDGLLNLDTFNLTISNPAVIVAPGTSASMIVAEGTGELRKAFTGTGQSFVYPVGDNSGLEYSPVTVNLTTGTGFTSSYIGVSLTDAKHPNNASATQYLSRYWKVTESGISGAQATVTGTYINSASDVAGTLANIKAALLTGAFNASTNPWNKTGGSVLSGTTLTYTGASLPSGQVTAFTGITGADPSVNITGGGNICQNASATLTASVTGGDGALTYLWTGLITGSTSFATATVNTATIGGPNAYTVTVTDANGIVATANGSVTIVGNTNYYADNDNDTYGDVTTLVSTCGTPPAGYITDGTDCNDADASKWRLGSFYVDADNDGFYNGNPFITDNVCYGIGAPSGYVADIVGSDCNDTNAAINPDHVEVLGNGIDDNCDSNFDEVYRLSYVVPAQCGITLTFIGNRIFAYEAPMATGYRFEVTNGAQVRTYDTTSNSIQLPNISGGAAYGTTYSIRIALKIDGYWRAYGASCTITTPATPATTKIVTSQCGSTLSLMANSVFADQVTNASQYRFEISGGPEGVRTYDSAANRFNMLNFSGGASYATTYAVRVALFLNGAWQDYGVACSITTPAGPPVTSLIASECGITISNSWASLFANPVSEAEGYRFEVSTTSPATSRLVDKPVNRFNLHELQGGFNVSTVYTIRVAILYGGVYQAFGPACTVTTAGALTKQADAANSELVVQVSPNPFTNMFRLNVQSDGKEAVTVKVYDMIGKLIEHKEANVADLNSLEVGNNYPSGVYNIIVTQGENIKTLRVIKR